MQHIRLQVGERANKGRHGQTVPKRKAEQVAFVTNQIGGSGCHTDGLGRNHLTGNTT